MALHLYDSATRRMRPFEPIEAGRVGMYVCGPTVQSAPHVGHLRTFLANLHVNAVFDVQSSALSSTAKRKVQTWGRTYGTILRDVYVEGVEDGSLRDLPPVAVVNSVLGMCNSIHRWLNPNGSISADQVLDTVVTMLTEGYRS